ncbi:MAG TPA: hypothetical protein VN381_12260 [Anaerovoracaceae bacterium]|nr:hypothetical protein [Anaerovoracaceae bacterium]
MRYQFNIEVELMLVNESDEKVELQYQEFVWEVPLIGPRPPYYANPRYELNFPII